MSEIKKVLLDTDIGDDIDDTLALLMLLKLKNIEIVGITTVFANTPLRARLAKKILKSAGLLDIPVFAGLGDPLSHTTDKLRGFVQQTDDLLNSEYAPNNTDVYNGNEAVDFILSCAKEYGKSLTILAIGPYTNIAAAYQKDSAAFKNIREAVFMGGCFYEQFIEYNVAMDPEAADIVIGADMEASFIGADVTWQAQLDDIQTKYVLNIRENSLRGYCSELVRLWKEQCWFNPVLHDPLAAYYVSDKSICQTEKLWIVTELNGKYTRGLTLNMDSCFKYLEHKTPRKKRICCAKSVDVERFIKGFLDLTFRSDD